MNTSNRNNYVNALMARHVELCGGNTVEARTWRNWALTVAHFCFNSGMAFDEAKTRLEIVVQKRHEAAAAQARQTLGEMEAADPQVFSNERTR